MSACLYLSISRYKNINCTFQIAQSFKLNILTAIFSGATERRRKLEMLEI